MSYETNENKQKEAHFKHKKSGDLFICENN